MQLCLSNYTIPRAVQLETIVLYCRQNARFPVHSSPPKKFQKCAARFLIRPAWHRDYLVQHLLFFWTSRCIIMPFSQFYPLESFYTDRKILSPLRSSLAQTVLGSTHTASDQLHCNTIDSI